MKDWWKVDDSYFTFNWNILPFISVITVCRFLTVSLLFSNDDLDMRGATTPMPDDQETVCQSVEPTETFFFYLVVYLCHWCIHWRNIITEGPGSPRRIKIINWLVFDNTLIRDIVWRKLNVKIYWSWIWSLISFQYKYNSALNSRLKFSLMKCQYISYESRCARK